MPGWQNDPVVQPAAGASGQWQSDPVVKPSPSGGTDINAVRAALMKAHDTGDLAEERRLSAILKQVDVPSVSLGETTMKPVSPDSMYQPTGIAPLDNTQAAISSAVNQLPVVGPPIEQGIATVQAAAHNALKPNDIPITAGDVVNTNRQREAANPKGTLAGKIIGGVAPYAVASELTLPAKLLGLEGSLASRIGFGTGSQFLINTGDNMTRQGEDVPHAATDAIVPTLLSMPLSLFGSPTRPGQIVTSELKRAGLTQADVDTLLQQMGPDAVIGDLTPRLQARTGAVATTDGPGRDIVVSQLQARAAGANARIQAATNNILGAEPVPSAVKDTISAGQDALGPSYRSALAGAYSGDPGDLIDSITGMMAEEKGHARSALDQVRRMLNYEQPAADGLPAISVPDPNPSGWLKTRQAIDGMLKTEADPNTIRVLTAARRRIDEMLMLHVPDIKNVDAQYEELAKQLGAVDRGQQVLDSGRTAPRPQELAAEMAQVVPERGIGPSGVPFRLSQGARAEIGRIIGTTANDRVALARLLKGEGSWNRDRLASIFGQDRADRLLQVFDNEARMAQTEQLAFGNSKTSLLQSAKEGLGRSDNGIVRSVLNAKIGDAVSQALDRVTLGASTAARRKANEEIARALMGRGAPQSEVGKAAFGAISRALAVQALNGATSASQ